MRMNKWKYQIKSGLSSYLNPKKHSYYLIYTLLFVGVCLSVFCWYIWSGRSLIWKTDGWHQHYKALLYYSKYLRSIVVELLENHHFSVPYWDFGIGEGSDILGTLNYYVMGDLFTLFSVFVPERYMVFYYEAMILLRIYLAGAVFSGFCFFMGGKNKISYTAVLAGAMTYAFCYWSISNAARHPYFLNPMIYLPLLVWGVEKILKKEKPYLFILSVAIAAVSNFYFFYVLTLITIVYVLIRVIYTYKANIKSIVITISRIGCAAIVGVLLAAVIFLPVCYIFLTDARMAVEKNFHLLYPLSHYSKLPGLFMSGGQSWWITMGYSAPTFVAVFLLFMRKKEHRQLKYFFVICILISLFPFFGQILNGFSYVTNRWSFAFAFLSSYILVIMWPLMMSLKQKEIGVLCTISIIYLGICFFLEYSRTANLFVSVIYVLLFLAVLLLKSDCKAGIELQKKQVLLLCILILSIGNISYWKNAPAGGNEAMVCMERGRIREELKENETIAVSQVAQNENKSRFYRYSGRGLTLNAGMLNGMSSTQYYWTLSNPNITAFRDELELPEGKAVGYEGYDDRSILTSLASVLYYVLPAGHENPVPFGFSYADTIDVGRAEDTIEVLKETLQIEELSEEQLAIIKDSKSNLYSVYRNEYALPLYYAYDKYMIPEAWKRLSAVEKQEAMLQAIVLSEKPEFFDEASVTLTGKRIPYSITCNSRDITLHDNEFIVTSPGASISLTFEGLENCETYLSIGGLSFTGMSEYDLYQGNQDIVPLNLYNDINYFLMPRERRESMKKDNLYWIEPTEIEIGVKTSTGVSKVINYYTPDYSYYCNRHDFTLNLDYSEEAVISVIITFPTLGLYEFNSLEIYAQPMESYIQNVSKLKQGKMNRLEMGTNSVSGEIFLEHPKILCFAIPYASGWSATVDGKKVKIYQANTMYMAIEMEAGDHIFCLEYETPFLKLGALISVISLFLFILFILIMKIKRTFRRQERHECF